jgi:hypothetical protein
MYENINCILLKSSLSTDSWLASEGMRNAIEVTQHPACTYNQESKW